MKKVDFHSPGSFVFQGMTLLVCSLCSGILVLQVQTVAN